MGSSGSVPQPQPNDTRENPGSSKFCAMEQPDPPSVEEIAHYEPLAINKAQLAQTDLHAEQIPEVLLEERLEAFVTEATADQAEDVLRVRTLFHWLKLQLTRQQSQLTELSVRHECALLWLKAIQAGKRRVSSFFCRLCSLAGIECAEVVGYFKGPGYAAGAPLTSANLHTWNCVRIQEAWRHVDISFHLLFSADPGTPDYSFCCSPDLFVLWHLPLDPHWQLLAKPLGEDQFWYGILPGAPYLSADARVTLHEDVGCVRLKLTFNRHWPVLLYPVVTSGTDSRVWLHVQQNSKACLKCSVHALAQGCHVIKIYCKSLSGSRAESALELFCEVPVVFGEATLSTERLPPHPTDVWGVQTVGKHYGLSLKTHADGEVLCEDGQATVELHLQPRVCVSAKLVDVEGISLPQRFAVLPNGRNNSIALLLQEAGVYALFLYLGRAEAKDVDPRRVQTWSLACTYLVRNPKSTASVPTFPCLTGQVFGSLPSLKECGLQTLHKHPPLAPVGERGFAVFQFAAISGSPRVYARWFRLSSEGRPRELKSQVLTNHTADGVAYVIAVCSKPGSYHLAVYGLNEERLEPVANYLLTSSLEFQDFHTFPIQHRNWCQGCRVLKPSFRSLASGSPISLELMVPGATAVRYQTSNSKYAFFKNSSDVWKAEGETGDTHVIVSASFENSEDYRPLLEYRVNNSNADRQSESSHFLESIERKLKTPAASCREVEVGAARNETGAPGKRSKKKRDSSTQPEVLETDQAPATARAELNVELQGLL